MQIGVFDSGLGGLLVTAAIARSLPDHDLLYLGDTARVPYGGRSQEVIHRYVSEALGWHFDQDCALVILACNTASAEALRRSQQEYLPRHYPERRVLGMIIPSAEAVFEAGTARRIGVIGTSATVESGAYEREIRRICPEVEVVSQATPLLVPLVENDGLEFAGPILDRYLDPLLDCDTLVLGCTHYAALKPLISERFSGRLVSQDEIIPPKLIDYLHRHPEMDAQLGRNGRRRFCVTDITSGACAMADRLFDGNVELEKVMLDAVA